MKKSLLFILMMAMSFIGFAQTPYWVLDFETTGGYTTDPAEYTDGSSDYFTRTDGSTINSYMEYTNKLGSYFFGAQDIDAEADTYGAKIPSYLYIDDIDISGKAIVEFSVYMADDAASDGNYDWDDADYVKFQYDVDNSGTYTDLIWVAGSATNTQPSIDANFDGIGDGASFLTSEFTKFTAALEVTGSTIDIRVIFSLDSGDEDIAIDNLTLSVSSNASDLFISEYLEGKINGNNRAIEIFNGTGADVDLSAYSIKQSHNGTGWGVDGIAYVLPLTGTLADGDVYVVANSSADASVLAAADLVLDYSDVQGHKIPYFTGNDALGLFKNDVIIDVVGTETGTVAWAVAGIASATQDHTLIRKNTVTEGNTDWTASAGTNADDSEWVVYDNAVADYTENIGMHTFGEPEVTGINVTFNVDMNGVAGFTAGTDKVYLGGDFVGNWATPGDAAAYEMTDSNTDGIYTLTVNLDPAGDIAYKYFINAGWDGGEWAGGDNRTATITEETTLNDVFGQYIYNVAIATAPFYAGDDITISWSSYGATNVNIEVWIPDQEIFMNLFEDTPADGSEPFTIPTDAWYSDKYYLRISNAANTEVFGLSDEFTIIATPTIYQIQSMTTDGDATEYKNQKVRTTGVITAISGSTFWMQEQAVGKDSQYPEYSAIYGYDAAFAGAVQVGDNVTLEATVTEYYTVTELVSVTSYTINSSGNIVAPTEVEAVNLAQEAYESVLVTIKGAEVKSELNGYNEFTINDGTADYVVDDKIYLYTPTLGEVLDITGVISYYSSQSSWRIYPRSADDVVDGGATGIDDLNEMGFAVYPNPSNGQFFVQLNNANNTKIEVFNVVGMKVMEVVAQQQLTKIDLSEMKQGVYYVRVDDGEQVLTQKVMKQ